MSPSETREIQVEAASSAASADDAVREALTALSGALGTQGATPGDLVSLTFSAPSPVAFHLSRPIIDGAWREVLGGLRRPIAYERGCTGFKVVGRAVLRPAVATPPVWRGMSAPEIARAYSPRQQADMAAVFRRWNADGAAARAGQGGLDLAYGPTRDERLDFYAAPSPDAPLWVFLHGGYWQACTKDQHGQFAEGMRAHGFAIANFDYGLAPETKLPEIVAQVRRALCFLVEQAQALGFDPARIHLAGHSAGAHLAALMAQDETTPSVASLLLLSGVFDLTPLTFLPMGSMIGLDDPSLVARLSPAAGAVPRARVGVALGALETDEFKRQSHELAAVWGAPEPLVVPGRHHFDLLEDLRADSDLLRLALRTAEG